MEYVLINPVIKDWNHDQYDYSQGNGIMENTMTIEYETVKYYTGAIGGVRPDTNVQGFASPEHYDQVPSPLNRPGGTQSILGQGGLIDAGIGIYQDLQAGTVTSLIGAVQKAGRAYQTFKGKDLKAIAKAETVQGVRDVLRNTIPGQVRAQPGSQTTTTNRTVSPIFPTPPRT